MFLQHIQEVNVVFDETSILKLIQKEIEDRYYEVKYNSYALVNAEFTNTEDGKPLVKVKYQKIVTTINPDNKDEEESES
jgi:hypothetical protein